MQILALREAGCSKIYKEMSGTPSDHSMLDRLIKELHENDTLVICNLDRIARSFSRLFSLSHLFMQRNIGFISLKEGIDTTTPQGRIIFNIFSSLSDFERNNRREKYQNRVTMLGTQKRGRRKGMRPESEATACIAETLYLERKLSATQIARKLNIDKARLYQYLHHRKVPLVSSGRHIGVSIAKYNGVRENHA
jgi:DNA invertase Pin-like site-specific DNA recombinase